MKALKFAERFLCIILVVCFVFSFTSCNDGENEITTDIQEPTIEAPIPGGSLSVPYYSSDSLNPFYSATFLNSAISSLVYRSLYKLDTSFSPIKDLALSESLIGLSLKIYFIPDLVFSDGGELTSSDIVYSFESAKKSNVYKERLKYINSCEDGGDNSVIFTLDKPIPEVNNALTFPIVKKASATSEDFLPIGNGYYQFSRDDVRLSLKANMKYAGILPKIGTVRLTDVTGNTAPENLVSGGELDFCFSDLADSSVGGVNCSVTNVYLNNLVYLGVNHSNVNLTLSSFRRAISYGISRLQITENAFRGFARGALVPFNTSWLGYTQSKTASTISFSDNIEESIKLLSEYGFGPDGIALNLDLVCSEGNGFIRNIANILLQMLAKINVNLTIHLLKEDELEAKVKNGEYDLYLAEIKLPVTMDISELILPEGGASYGINFDNITSDEKYISFQKSEITMDEFLETFLYDMPFIPLAYRNGRFCYTRKVTSALSCTESFIYGDIDKWTFSEGLQIIS